VTQSARRVRALSIHADYHCRHTGVCCSSGWDVPVEPEVELHLRNALSSGALRVPEAAVSSLLPDTQARRASPCFRPVAGLPHGARVVFASDSAGRCVFLEADRRCAVHRQLGLEALAAACRDFPRAATLTPLGVSITLSHFCPTAAGMLFAPVSLRVVEGPPAFPVSWPYEGLEAREAWPPLLRPGVLMDWPSLERWERFAVGVLAGDGRSPEAALDLLAATAEEARRWTPHDGPFPEHFERVLEGALEQDGQQPAFHEALRNGSGDARDPALWGSRAWHLVASCVPHRALLPPAPEGLNDADTRLLAPHWPSLAGPIRRWLAAKAFASWLVLQGEGLRTTIFGLRLALGLLRTEAARGCADAGRALDPDLLKEAVRRSDLLLVHLANPEALARRLSHRETAEAPPAAW
jgi:Fe-S-cluster containining protein